MKKLLFTLAALVVVLTSNAQIPTHCPASIHLTSMRLTLTYTPSLPNGGFIDQVRVQLQNGTWKTLSLHSQSGNTIVFNNQNAGLRSTDVVKDIRLYRSGQPITQCQGNTQLPVDLTIFEGKRSSDNITFNFQTAMELNNSHFELQGLEGEEFVTVAFQTGMGTTNEVTDYQIIVDDLNIELFRLKQVDFDGTVSFSDVIRVELNEEDKPLRTMRINVLGVETPDGNIILEIYKDKVIRKGITIQ